MTGLETRLRCRKFESAIGPAKGTWKMICLLFPYLFIKAWQKNKCGVSLESSLFFFFRLNFKFFCVFFFWLTCDLSVSGWASCILDFYRHGSWVNWAFDSYCILPAIFEFFWTAYVRHTTSYPASYSALHHSPIRSLDVAIYLLWCLGCLV